jgi:hypothetical protein
MNVPLIDINKAMQASYTALACHLPESIRPCLLAEFERLVNIAQNEQLAKDNAKRLEESKYNGWSNRETWLVGLWWSECPIESIEADTKEEAQYALAEQLEELFHELHPVEQSGLLSDLIGGAVARIDWRELAEHWIDDIQVTLSETETETEPDIHNLVEKQLKELESIFSQPSESKLTNEDLELLKKLTDEKEKVKAHWFPVC